MAPVVIDQDRYVLYGLLVKMCFFFFFLNPTQACLLWRTAARTSSNAMTLAADPAAQDRLLSSDAKPTELPVN